MTEIDLLTLARSASQTVSADFAQVIGITSAMVVAIYYFLHQAGPRMKIFAFVIYTCGMLLYLGMMLQESAFTRGVLLALTQIPEPTRSIPTQYLIGIRASWVGTAVTTLVNLVYWILWLGTSYLLFFWKKRTDETER